MARVISAADISRLLNEGEKDMKNSAGRGGCYPPRPKCQGG